MGSMELPFAYVVEYVEFATLAHWMAVADYNLTLRSGLYRLHSVSVVIS